MEGGLNMENKSNKKENLGYFLGKTQDNKKLLLNKTKVYKP